LHTSLDCWIPAQEGNLQRVIWQTLGSLWTLDPCWTRRTG
jgi:hypothetical protein